MFEEFKMLNGFYSVNTFYNILSEMYNNLNDITSWNTIFGSLPEDIQSI